MSYKAILFDLDNTLIDRDAAFRACLPPGSEQTLLELDGHGHGDRAALFAAWSRWEAMDQQSLADRLCSHLSPDPRVQEALRSLGRRVKIAVVSNGGGRTQRRKLAASGLDQIFSRIYISGEVGLAKPDPGFFEKVAGELGVLAHECLYVGDHPQTDQVGAEAAGMTFQAVEAPLSAAQIAGLGPTKGAAVLLAAGASRRMGRPKALLPWREGTFLSLATAKIRALAVSPRICVTRADLDLPLPPDWLSAVNPDPDRGMLSSLQSALRHLRDEPDWLLVALVDQPEIQPETFQKMVQNADPDSWTCPSYQGRAGHPVVIGRACFEALRQASPNRSPKDVLKDFPRRFVDCDDPGILLDFDTPEDLRRCT